MSLDLYIAFDHGAMYSGANHPLTEVTEGAINFRRPSDLIGPPMLFNRLKLNPDGALFDRIEKIPKTEIDWVEWFEDEGLKERSTNAYGDKVVWVKAGDLAACFDPTIPKQKRTLWNVAVAAMVSALHPDTVVYLWWC